LLAILIDMLPLYHFNKVFVIYWIDSSSQAYLD
jgi:hypothetical protein